MKPVQKDDHVFAVIQQVKLGAPGYCTNFFPAQPRLQKWIDHGELAVASGAGVAFFFRKDRDFWHLYYCAASGAALEQGLAGLLDLKTKPVVTDLVGGAEAVKAVRPALEGAGFRRHTQLQRMMRLSQSQSQPIAGADEPVVLAEPADAPAVLALIEGAFDRYGEQLPMLYEVEAAIENHQVLVVRRDGALAGVLFFESQGLASVIRFWAVAGPFRDSGCGSALIRRYFEAQSAVRRFTLWVNAANENAIQKYQHYGYAPDGLVDCVLANELIRQ